MAAELVSQQFQFAGFPRARPLPALMSDPLAMIGAWAGKWWRRRLRTSAPPLLCSTRRWTGVARSRFRLLIRWPGWPMGTWTSSPAPGEAEAGLAGLKARAAIKYADTAQALAPEMPARAQDMAIA